jgi:NADH-quinone oxidoreductase subunit M
LEERAAALNGVFLQMFNHGLTAATLFWLAGVLEERGGGRRGLNDFGGLRQTAPVLCGLMGVALFASLGLPGLNGFVGEFLIFKGAYPLAPGATALSALGLLLTAVFILTLIQRVFHGPLSQKWATLPDLTLRERTAVAPALALMLLLGVCPQLIVGPINTTVARMAEDLSHDDPARVSDTGNTPSPPRSAAAVHDATHLGVRREAKRHAAVHVPHGPAPPADPPAPAY